MAFEGAWIQFCERSIAGGTKDASWRSEGKGVASRSAESEAQGEGRGEQPYPAEEEGQEHLWADDHWFLESHDASP